MKKIKVEDESLIEHFGDTIDTLDAISSSIVKLSKKARMIEKTLWITIKGEFPETDGFNCAYNKKRNEILILHKEEEDPLQ